MVAVVARARAGRAGLGCGLAARPAAAGAAVAAAAAARRGPAPARGVLSVEQANTAYAVYAGGFGVCLFLAPEACFGAEGFVPYFTAAFCGVATFFARVFGALNIALGIVPYVQDKSSKLSLAMGLTGAVLMLPIFVMNAMNGAPFLDWMWKAQAAVHAVLCAAMYNAGWME